MAMQLETATSPFPDASLDQDDLVYPCKGCGEILEEGKAFELAGNRWHIDCFRCNTCGTLLDSDANLLLLGDGSLICNNCTYSCSACNNKIEDLAILTGDQAFCANCFRCRNCKRKIDNLRYARTSQGIFCMSCHESLMARRRKNKKASRNPVPARDGLNKSLPSLPPPGVSREEFEALDGDTLQDEQLSSSVYSATASSTRHGKRTTDGGRPSISREVSSPTFNDDSRRTTADDQTLLPASTFSRVNNNDNRASSNSKTLSYADDGAAMFGSVPFMLDPQDTLMEEASPPSRSSDYVETKSKPERGTSRDYFGRAPTASSARDSSMREPMQENSRHSSIEGARAASPHIASQAKEQDRKPSEHISEAMKQRTSARTSQQNTPTIASPAPQQTPQDESGFKLQDAPRPRKTSTSQRTSRNEGQSSAASTPVVDQNERSSARNEPTPRGNERDRNLDAPPRLVERISYVSDDWPSPDVASPRSIQQTLSKEVERPKRGDSLAAAALKPVSRKEVGSASTSGPTTPTIPQPSHGRDTSLSSSAHNGSRLGHYPVESPESTTKTAFEPPPRAASRPNMNRNEPSDSSKDVFTMPRAPPPAPPITIARHGPTASLASLSSMRSDMSQSTQKSPNLPRGSTGGEFGMAEEMERIMQEGGNEEVSMRSQPSVLRKVSNAVKHGRSFSDRPARSERSSQSNSRDWPKSPLNGSMEISSPTSATSPATAHEENILLKNKLKQAQDRISRLEVEKNGLQELVTNNVDISQVNTELRQKRSTMAILDTQREVVVRELEVMTDHLKRAKDTDRALDVNELKSGINRDFAASLQRLKDSLGQEIEKLMQKRADLTREIDDLIQMKDKGFEEYEALSTRNHQLSKHNNELIQSIQGNMKANAHHQHGEHGNSFDGGRQAPNGLGLYIAQNSRQGMRQEQADVRHLQDSSTDYSQTTLVTDPDAEPIVVASPQVIKIGKGKANVFKKGTQGFVKGLRNVRKEFASERTDRPMERNNSMPYSYSIESTQGTPYGQMSQGQGPESGSRVDMQQHRATPTEQPRQRIGDFFRGQGGNEKGHLRHLKQGNNGSFQNLAESAGNANLIFGIDLTTRCEYEKRFVPYIVTRCIEEVELRGMDVEGIYRKSGGTGQVNQIRAGFERDNDFDISDPELDIHAVTSALKQFLRKLPMPLISYDVYEDLLDCARIEDQRARAQPMKEAIQGLPKAHRDCLEFLMFHLAKVMAQEKQNLMTPLNLAVVFAPTIMRPQSIEREMQDMQLQRVTVQSILEMNQIIFGYDT